MAIDDTISRQVAVDTLEELTANGTNKGMIFGKDAVHRIEMLPPAQPEPCEDAVSRKAALDEIQRFIGYIDQDMINRIHIGLKRLPPVTPKQDWIPVEKDTPKSSEYDLEYPTVLACFCDGTIDTACFYESTKEWGCGDEYEHICHPVAWMPLPEPYADMRGEQDG